MKNSKSFDPLLPARLDLGPLSPASSPFSPASASAAVSPMMIDQSLGAHPSEQDGDSDADPGSMRHERGGKRDAGGAMLAVSSSQRPSAISSRSTSAGEGEPVSSVSSGSREDSLARLGPSRQSSSSQVGASASSVNSPAPFGQSRLSLPSSSSGVALHQLSPGAANTEAPPLLLSPQLLDHYSPAPRERATTTPAAFPGHVLTPMSQLAPTLGGPFPPVSPNPSVGSPYEGGGAAGPMGSRRNYYDESPDPSPSAGMSVSQAGVHTPSTSSMYPANRSTPHSRSHSPRHPSFASTSSLYSSSSSGGGSGGVMMSPTQIERQSSFGHPSPFERQSSRGERERQETPQEAAARLREEQYWEEQNSATYPARRPFLPPNRKPSPAVMQRPAYFNPHASPSPPPNQTGGVGRMHSFSNPPYYQPQQGAGQHHHTHSQQVQAHSSSHHGGGLNKQNTWSPGQLRQSPSDYKQQQQTQSGSHASPVPGSASSFHPDRMYGEGESGAGSMSASPAPGPRYPSGGGFPPSLYHAATLPSSSSGSARMHYHSVSQHTSPHHPGRHSYSSSGVIGGGAGHSHSTSPSSMNHGGAGASGPGGPMMSISSSGEGEGSGSHHVSLTDLNDPRSSTTSPHSVHSSSDSTEDSDSSHIISWLRSSHFTEYIPLFLHHEVSLEMIRGGEIEESDLQNMGIEALGVRKKMMRAIRGEQQQQQQKGAQMQQQAHAYPYGASSSNYHNDREGSHQSDRQTPQHFYSSPPISTSNNALSTHTDPESTSGTPRATSPMNTDGTREQHRESRHSLPSNSPVHYSSTSDSHRLSLTSTNNGSGSGKLYLGPPPISHHPHSDLGEYHRGGERERMQSGRYSVTANETGGGGGGGGYIYGNDRNNASLSVPQTTMDLMHSRSQSHDSLHPALLLSPGQYQPPSNNNDGGNRGGLSSSQQYQPNNDRHPTNDRHQQQSVSQLALHISFLQASPLLHSESPGRSHALNIEKETELIRDSLIESGRQFRVRFSIATKQNLLKMLTKVRET
jgi:hypothetical protein